MQSVITHLPRFFQPLIMLRLACALALAACQTSPDEKTSSTSISTGNPVGLTFHIEKDSKPVSFTGTLEIYETDQIPVDGYRPNPLLQMHLESVDSVRLDTSAIMGIPHALWWDSLAEDSADAFDTQLEFNVVFKGDSLGAILKGFRFDSNSRRFIPSIGINGADSEGNVHAGLSRLVDYIGRLPPDLLNAHMDYYLFIYGTGYGAKGIGDARNGESLLFTIPKLPVGQHDAFLIPFPWESWHTDPAPDSTVVFALESPLRTDSDSLQRGVFDRFVELPDSLKFGQH